MYLRFVTVWTHEQKCIRGPIPSQTDSLEQPCVLQNGPPTTTPLSPSTAMSVLPRSTHKNKLSYSKESSSTNRVKAPALALSKSPRSSLPVLKGGIVAPPCGVDGTAVLNLANPTVTEQHKCATQRVLINHDADSPCAKRQAQWIAHLASGAFARQQT